MDKQCLREYAIYLILPALALVMLGFISGFFAGRNFSQPVVQYVVPEREEPIRSYIISQRAAGTDEWIHILCEEYETNIDFVEKRWGRWQ